MLLDLAERPDREWAANSPEQGKGKEQKCRQGEEVKDFWRGQSREGPARRDPALLSPSSPSDASGSGRRQRVLGPAGGSHGLRGACEAECGTGRALPG